MIFPLRPIDYCWIRCCWSGFGRPFLCTMSRPFLIGCKSCQWSCHSDCSSTLCPLEPCGVCLTFDNITHVGSAACIARQRATGCHACHQKKCWGFSVRCTALLPTLQLSNALPPLSLRNSGQNFCYLNALLQVLTRVPLLRSWVSKHYEVWHALHVGQNYPLRCLGKDFQAIGERLAPEPYAPEICVRVRHGQITSLLISAKKTSAKLS